MKIKRFNENLQDIPVVGDYVLAKIDVSNSSLVYKDELMKFVNNTIGQISKIRINMGDIVVVYDNVPNKIKSWFNFTGYDNDNDSNGNKYNVLYSRSFDFDRIVMFGKTIEEVELKMISNKYNL